jgi:hypothetical protein
MTIFLFDFVQKKPSQARKLSQAEDQAKPKTKPSLKTKPSTKPSQANPSHQLFFGFQANPIQATKFCWLAEV